MDEFFLGGLARSRELAHARGPWEGCAMGRFALALIVALPLLPAPALAAGPGKRFAHNRGTWTGSAPIEVAGHVDHPRSIAVRVRWRTLQPPEPKPAPQPPTTGALRAAATPIPGEGIVGQVAPHVPAGPHQGGAAHGLVHCSVLA